MRHTVESPVCVRYGAIDKPGIERILVKWLSTSIVHVGYNYFLCDFVSMCSAILLSDNDSIDTTDKARGREDGKYSTIQEYI